MTAVRHGATRTVLLIGPYAVKVPSLRHGTRNFLTGMLANMQEATFAKAGWPVVCPVLFSLPVGLVVILPRCAPVESEPDVEWWQTFTIKPDYEVPVEWKRDSLGVLDGRIVAVDYGS